MKVRFLGRLNAIEPLEEFEGRETLIRHIF